MLLKVAFHDLYQTRHVPVDEKILDCMNFMASTLWRKSIVTRLTTREGPKFTGDQYYRVCRTACGTNTSCSDPADSKAAKVVHAASHFHVLTSKGFVDGCQSGSGDCMGSERTVCKTSSDDTRTYSVMSNSSTDKHNREDDCCRNRSVKL
jgi:hypothetical protein